MGRQAELNAQIKVLQEELRELDPAKHMTVRELAKAAGVSPGTAARFKVGKVMDMKSAIKLLPFTPNCPCCGAPTAAPRTEE